MRFVFIHAWKALWPVSVQCEVLEVSRSGAAATTPGCSDQRLRERCWTPYWSSR